MKEALKVWKDMEERRHHLVQAEMEIISAHWDNPTEDALIALKEIRERVKDYEREMDEFRTNYYEETGSFWMR